MKTILITGANAGIGLKTAEQFVNEGHHVILACRNMEKAQQARQLLQQQGKGQVDLIELDLNSLEKINHSANQILSQYNHIDVLINNAGLISTHLARTEDGFEKHFGVNYLGHYLWTLKLLPLLKKAQQGRIIHLSSLAHWHTGLDVFSLKIFMQIIILLIIPFQVMAAVNCRIYCLVMCWRNNFNIPM